MSLVVFFIIISMFQFFLAGVHFTTWLERQNKIGLVWTLLLITSGIIALLIALNKLG